MGKNSSFSNLKVPLIGGNHKQREYNLDKIQKEDLRWQQEMRIKLLDFQIENDTLICSGIETTEYPDKSHAPYPAEIKKRAVFYIQKLVPEEKGRLS